MRKVILLFILITSVLGAWADGNVTFTASAPDVVVSGEYQGVRCLNGTKPFTAE